MRFVIDCESPSSASKARWISAALSRRSPRTAQLAHPRPAGRLESLLDSFPRLGIKRRAAEPLALPTGSLKAGADSLLNDRPLELGKDAHHAEKGLACRRGRVDALLLQAKVDLERVKLGKKADQVLQ